MRMGIRFNVRYAAVCSVLALSGCNVMLGMEDPETLEQEAGDGSAESSDSKGGSAGNGGSAGAPNLGGSAGADSGSPGAGGSAGMENQGGSAGIGGSAGAENQGGSAGIGGSAGAENQGGSAGIGGSAGTENQGGSAGIGGSAGAENQGGSSGADAGQDAAEDVILGEDVSTDAPSSDAAGGSAGSGGSAPDASVDASVEAAAGAAGTGGADASVDSSAGGMAGAAGADAGEDALVAVQCPAAPEGGLPCGTPLEFFEDRDQDGHGLAGGQACLACTQPIGFVASSDDCNDTNASVHPGVGQVALCDGVDNDCDGKVDEFDLLNPPAADLPLPQGTKTVYSNYQYGPGPFQAAVFNGTEYAIIAPESAGGGSALRLYHVDRDRQVLPNPLTLVDDTDINTKPAMVWTGSQYVFGWISNHSGGSEVFVGGADKTGVRTIPDTQLTTGASAPYPPMLAWNGAGGLAYWVQSDGWRAVSVSESGVIGTTLVLPTTVRRLAVVPRSAGGFLAVWADNDQKMHARLVTAEGAFGAPETTWNPTRDPTGPTFAHTVGDRVMVVQTADGQGFEVSAHDHDGNVLAGPAFRSIAAGTMKMVGTTAYADRVLVSQVTDGPRFWEFRTDCTLSSAAGTGGYYFVDLRQPPFLAADGPSVFAAVNQYGGWTRMGIFTCH